MPSLCRKPETGGRFQAYAPLRRFAEVTPHSLRHGAVARWIAAGQSDPYVLSRWLGHSTPVIVYRTYAHLLPQDTTAITERMEAEAERAKESTHDVPVVVPIRSGGHRL